MRVDKDFSKSPVSKKKMLESLIDMGYNPVYSFDDRQDCAEMFQSMGVYSMLVGENLGPVSY
jgi:hypothetical protein